MKITKDMIKKGTVFHCDTEEKANELLGKLDKLGYKWADSKSYLDFNRYNTFKENTCYHPCIGTYCNVIFSKINNYKIIEYELDKDSKEFTMDNIKDGYLVKLRNGNKYLCYNDFYGRKCFLNSELDSFVYCRQYCNNFDINRNGETSDYDIMQIFGRSRRLSYLSKYTNSHRDILWYREEEDKITEMTMEEVCKKLGENIKIVK